MILKEGKYDKLVNKLSKQTMEFIKFSRDIYLEDHPNFEDQKKFDTYYIEEIPLNVWGLDFLIEINIKRISLPNIKEGIDFDGGYYYKDDILSLSLHIDPNKEPKNYNYLLGVIKDVYRHELTHATQAIRNELTDEDKYEETWEYFILPHEIPAMVHGLYSKAKHLKKDFKEVAKHYLSKQFELGNIETQEQYKKILKIWTNYYNKNIKL